MEVVKTICWFVGETLGYSSYLIGPAYADRMYSYEISYNLDFFQFREGVCAD